MFWSAGCWLLRAEGFFWSLEVLYEGLGISKLQLLIKKFQIFFLAVNFFQFLVIKTLDPDWIWIGIPPKMKIRIRTQWIWIRNTGFYSILYLFLKQKRKMDLQKGTGNAAESICSLVLKGCWQMLSCLYSHIVRYRTGSLWSHPNIKRP